MGKRGAATGVVLAACACAAMARVSAAQDDILVGDVFGHRIVRFAWSGGEPVDHFVADGVSSLAYPRSMAYGPDGNLYVASSGTNEVLAFDGRTGALTSVFVAQGSGGLSNPTGLAFGPDGDLYVCSAGTDSVLCFDGATGAFISTFVSPGAGGLDDPSGISFDAAGRLVVGSFIGDAVLCFDGMTGAYVMDVIPAGALGLDGPTGLARLDSGGYLVASHLTDAILAVDPDGAISMFVAPGATPLDGPQDIIMSPDGDLLVAHSGSGGGVLRFARDGALVGEYVAGDAGGMSGTPGSLVAMEAPCIADCNGDGALNVLDFVCFQNAFAAGCDAQEFVLVGDAFGNSIVRFQWPGGQVFDHFVGDGVSSLQETRSMLYGPDGHLYVASWLTDEVLKFDERTGQLLSPFIAQGAGGLDGPVDVEFGLDGNVYVSSDHTDSVLRYDGVTGAFIDTFVAPGAGGLDRPHGIDFDADGSLIVASRGSDAVLRFDGDTGAFIDQFIPVGTPNSRAPVGLLRLAGGRYLVTSYWSHAIVARDPDGTIFTFVAAGAAPMNAPAGMALDPEGNLLVACAGEGGSVLRFDLSGQFLGEYVSGDAGGLSGTPVSVCMMPDPQQHCPGDCNGDGVLNILDFISFQDEFVDGCR